MRQLLLSLTVLLTITVAYGQTPNWLWAKGPKGTVGGEGYAICTDKDGNVFITGWFAYAPLIFGSDTLNNTGSSDVFIAKYDSNGNVLWAKSAIGTGQDNSYSVSADGDGNVFIAGFFRSPTITFGPYTLTNNSTTGFNNLFLAKYDPSGNILWAESAGGTNNDYCYSINADTIGNVFLTGTFQSPTITFGTTTLINAGSYGNIFLTKYNSSGNVVWAKSAGGAGGDEAYSICTNALGNLFLTGRFSSPTITFGPTTLTNVAGADVFIAKYDSLGNALWAKSAGGTFNEGGSFVSSDAGGNVIVTGYFYSNSITFDSITFTRIGTGGSDAFIVKYDSAGNIRWAKSAGGLGDDIGYSVSTDESNNVFATGGFTSSNITFDAITLTPDPGSPDPMFIVKYDENGNVLCASHLESGGDDNSGVAVDAYGNTYIGGDYKINPFVVGTDTLLLTGSENIFVAKYRCDNAVAVSELTDREHISVFPNPFSTQTIIHIERPLKDATLTVYNLYGQVTKQINNISGQSVTLYRDNLSGGLYFFRIMQGNKILSTDKLVITDN